MYLYYALQISCSVEGIIIVICSSICIISCSSVNFCILFCIVVSDKTSGTDSSVDRCTLSSVCVCVCVTENLAAKETTSWRTFLSCLRTLTLL